MVLSSRYHQSVLLEEVSQLLNVDKGKKYIDATIDGAGYAEKIIGLGGKVLGFDVDHSAIAFLEEKIKVGWIVSGIKIEKGKNLFLVHENFANIKREAHHFGFDQVSAIVFDLGLSNYQLEKGSRGFSYLRDEFLDMRMDQSLKIKAWDIINKYPKERLYEIFTKNSEELNSWPITEAIFRARTLRGEIVTTGHLADIIETALKKIYEGKKGNQFMKILRSTLARIFQAVRIEVNQELANLEKALSDSISCLFSGGRILVVSFHSLEDRIVKLKMREWARKGKVRLITRKAIRPKLTEIIKNPASRSAKLRAVELI